MVRPKPDQPDRLLRPCIHTAIEQDCKSIHLLLADNKHNEATAWAKQCFDDHPCEVTLEVIITWLNNLLKSCKICCDHKLTLSIEQSIFTLQHAFSELSSNSKKYNTSNYWI